jgi:hypothetical protein
MTGCDPAELRAAKPRLLYSTYGFTLTTVAAAPLPTLVFRAHDSALITDNGARKRTGWYDSYAFDAQAGQRLTIGNARAKGTVVNLLGPEVTSEAHVPYSVTLAIR